MIREFAKRGLGYRMDLPEVTTDISVDMLVRNRGELHGELTVRSALPGVKASEGILHEAHVNLSASRSRKQIADQVKERAQTNGDIDWFDVLEEFCRKVLAAEREGEPAIRVGTLPRPIRPEYRLDPLIPLASPVMLYGEGGTGKSTLGAAVCVSVETGVTVIPGFVPRQAPTLYLDWEADRDEINDRVRAVATGAHLPKPASILYRQCFGPLYRQVEPVARIIAAEGIGLAVIDSVGLAAGVASEGGGDAAETALRLYGALRALATVQRGCSFLLIHHVSKQEAGDGSRPAKPYGSIFHENLARSTFELRAGLEGTLGLYNQKANKAEKVGPIALQIEHAEDGSITYDRLDALPADLIRSLPIHEQIHRLLLTEGHMEQVDIAEALDMEKNKVRAILSRYNGRLFGRLSSGKWEAIPKVQQAQAHAS